MLRRIAPITLALLIGLVAPGHAAHQNRHQVIASLRACEGIAKCDAVAKRIYDEAFAKNEPVIELVTMGIGALIWERHGHIALCVRYADPGDDVCYNYGIGDFQNPASMGWGFFRGTKSFWAGEQTVLDLMNIYAGRDRTVWAQPIPLTLEQKTKVIAKLHSDILEDNRYYAYDHFFDNCTTRVRDILDDNSGKALSSMTEETDGKTFRDLARDGFYGMRIPLLITDIAMGRITDRVPSYWERMFLPQYLREAVQKKWGIEPIVLYQRVGDPPLDDGPSGRWLFALVILAATAPAWIARWFGRFQRLGMAFAILPPVLLGTVLWFLAIISPLGYVMWNESCLVFFPFDLALLVLSPARRRIYARGRVAMLGLIGVLMVIGVFKQPLFAPLLWPLIPAAVVGFWPAHWTRKRAEPAKPAKPAKKR